MLYVRDLMSVNLFTLQPTDSLKAAKSLMNLARVRHIPVVDQQCRFVGLLTHRDILAVTISLFAEVERTVQDEIDSGIPVAEIMHPDVLTVSPETRLRDAADTLLRHKYGCLPVVENGCLVGILTEADFLRLTISLMDAMEQV